MNPEETMRRKKEKRKNKVKDGAIIIITFIMPECSSTSIHWKT